MRALTAAALAAALLAGRPAIAQDIPYEPTGEVRLHGFGSVGAGTSFDETRVVGPTVNLTRREDGTWGGDLLGENVNLHSEGQDRIVGSNVSLKYSHKGGTTKVEGLFYGRRVRIEMTPKKFEARLGACSFDLARRSAQVPTFFGDVGCSSPRFGVGSAGKATLDLIGQAASEAPPLPHLALALVSLMNG